MAYTQLTQEQYDRVHNFMSDMRGKESHNHPAEKITELFNIHNMCFPNNPEYSKSCGGCRARVYNRMKTFWSETKATYGY
jgi:hypothetical protein